MNYADVFSYIGSNIIGLNELGLKPVLLAEPTKVYRDKIKDYFNIDVKEDFLTEYNSNIKIDLLTAGTILDDDQLKYFKDCINIVKPLFFLVTSDLFHIDNYFVFYPMDSERKRPGFPDDNKLLLGGIRLDILKNVKIELGLEINLPNSNISITYNEDRIVPDKKWKTVESSGIILGENLIMYRNELYVHKQKLTMDEVKQLFAYPLDYKINIKEMLNSTFIHHLKPMFNIFEKEYNTNTVDISINKTSTVLEDTTKKSFNLTPIFVPSPINTYSKEAHIVTMMGLSKLDRIQYLLAIAKPDKLDIALEGKNQLEAIKAFNYKEFLAFADIVL